MKCGVKRNGLEMWMFSIYKKLFMIVQQHIIYVL